MPDTRKCARCKIDLEPGATQGLCPRCLIALSLSAPTEAPTGCEDDAPPIEPHHQKVPPPEEIAALFPQLEILEFLGRGGMGVVYKARQPKLNRFVALKLLAPDKNANPKFAERFVREAQALARLSHPNIVTVYDFGETHGQFFLLMEYVDGLNLRELLHRGHLPPEVALAIVPAVCDALQYAHQNGVVHRDIKPENILRDKEGRVKIADFGIAKMLSPNERTLTRDQQVVGTPHYMAPEQVEHPDLVDHRADIYSLGVIFYEMLTGELPLGKFQPPSSKVHVDVRLDEVVLRALAKEPERRYQNVSDIKTQLETIVTHPGQPPKLPYSGTKIIPPQVEYTRSSLFSLLLKVAAASAAVFLILWLTLATPLLKRPPRSKTAQYPEVTQSFTRAVSLDNKVEFQVTTADAGQRVYQGGFIEQPLALIVPKLPPHKLLRITFDLHLAGAWENSSTNLDEILWDLTLNDGRTLLHTTFANAGVLTERNEQCFPDSYPCRPHPARTGCIKREKEIWPGSGRTWDLASAYHLVLAVPHTNDAATFQLKAPPCAGKDRSYGLANVRVDFFAEQIPKTEEEFSLLWTALGSHDPYFVHKAQWDFIAAGDASVNYLARHLDESIDLHTNAIKSWISNLNSKNSEMAKTAETVLIGQGRLAHPAISAIIDREGPAPDGILKLVNIQWSLAHYPETASEVRLHRARKVLLAIGSPAAQKLASQISADHYYPKGPISKLIADAKGAAEIADWPKAAQSFQQLVDLGAADQRHWAWAMAANLAAGDTNAYTRLRAGYLRRFGLSSEPGAAHRFAKQCLIDPALPRPLLVRATDLAQSAVNKMPSYAWPQLAKGMAEYRRGDFSNALETLAWPQRSGGHDVATLALAFRAMAWQKLGDSASARKALDDFNRRLNMYLQTGELAEEFQLQWDNKALAFIVRAEAERLILGKEVSPSVDPTAVAAGRARWQPIRELLKAAKDAGKQRKWTEASDAFYAALGQPGFSWDLWEQMPLTRYTCGLAFLLAGNEPRHIELCRMLLDRTNSEVTLRGMEAYAAVALAKPEVLAPDLQNRALDYARQACLRSETERSYVFPLLKALLEYRQGQYSNVLTALTGKDSIYDPVTKARAVALRGMAHFRLGQTEHARRALEKAETYFSHGPAGCCVPDPEWWGWGLAEVALQELRALLRVKEAPRPQFSGAITVGPAAELGRLTFAGSVSGEELNGVVDLTFSTNGYFLYAASHVAGAISVYARDPASGQLSPVQFLHDSADLHGAISIRLSPDQRYAVAACLRSRALVLFKRDPEKGTLEQIAAVKDADGIQGLYFPVRARFSLDGRHIYSLNGGGAGGITAFAFAPETGLRWLQTLTNNSTAGGSRALAMLPEGNSIVTVNSRSHTLTLFDRDPVTGRLSLRQALSDEDAGATQIEGQFGVTAARDGQFVYVCSGRFSGDNSVSAFRVTDAGKLAPIQSFVNGEDGLTFIGGNEVIVTPDGLNVYATATVSGTLACFARDPQTGRLRLIQSFVNDKRTVLLDSPAGLECSPDGRFIYVPTEFQKGISIYRRELTPSTK